MQSGMSQYSQRVSDSVVKHHGRSSIPLERVAAGDAAAAAVRALQLRESARIRGGVPQLLRLQGLRLQPAVQLPRVLLVRQQLLPRVAVGAATIGITAVSYTHLTLPTKA